MITDTLESGICFSVNEYLESNKEGLLAEALISGKLDDKTLEACYKACFKSTEIFEPWFQVRMHSKEVIDIDGTVILGLLLFLTNTEREELHKRSWKTNPKKDSLLPIQPKN